MKKSFLILLAIAFVPCFAQASVWLPFATVSGGVGVYYNNSTEIPTNQAYYRAQFANSTTAVNGAAVKFSSAILKDVFGDKSTDSTYGQFGLDFIIPAATSTVTLPTLTVYDNTNNAVSGRSAAGTALWAIDDYKSGAYGPTTATNVVINSPLRGYAGTASVSLVSANPGVSYTVNFTAELDSDAIYHWYNPTFVDDSFSLHSETGYVLTGKFMVQGELTYYVATDTTPGMDFYAGTVAMTAEAVAVPEPSSIALLCCGAAGLLFVRRRVR